MILSELIERIKFVAIGAGEGPANPRLLDSEVLIELIIPRCLQRITEETTLNESRIKELVTAHNIDVVAGVGTLPETVLVKWIKSSYVTAPSNLASYISSYMMYALDDSALVDTYHVQGDNFLYRETGTAINAFTGGVVLWAVTVPILPALISSTVDVPDYMLEQLITLSAAVVNGQSPLTNLVMDSLNAR